MVRESAAAARIGSALHCGAPGRWLCVHTAVSLRRRYYRDRLSVPRGPCNISVLRESWVHGVIDEHTLVWGQGLGDWLPARNIRTLVPQIRTVEGAGRAWPLCARVTGPFADLLHASGSAGGDVDKAHVRAQAGAGAGAQAPQGAARGRALDPGGRHVLRGGGDGGGLHVQPRTGLRELTARACQNLQSCGWLTPCVCCQ